MGCSITLLLERVDFTGRIKWPVGGLIETRNRWCGVARGSGLFLSLFSRFSPATAFAYFFLLGCARKGGWPSATLLALLRDFNATGVVMCLGRLVAAENGFLLIGRLAVSES